MTKNNDIICPLCYDKVDRLLFRFHIDSERYVLDNIKKQNPGWTENDGICARCIDYYHSEIVIHHRLLPEIGPHFPVKSPDDFIILPTAIRLHADPRYTGKGVTICFIDSGFYRHPDLEARKNRIKLIVDITEGNRQLSLRENCVANTCWHGTMTSVVCAGDGFLSNGLYKGIASDAELVLLKVQDEEGRIKTDTIVQALEWVKKNHLKYNIRIVNLSLSADEVVSEKTMIIDQIARELSEEGVNLVAAVGNNEFGEVKSPANSVHVLAVGGIDDHNDIDEHGIGLYHSTFGKTIEGLNKPELTANAIWIAAPILPGTSEKDEAEALHDLINEDQSQVVEKLRISNDRFGWGIGEADLYNASLVSEKIIERIQQTKFFSAHYMHVDGTSFAAPIVCSVIAQLLEADPTLSCVQVRSILFSTAKRLQTLPVERQGFGYIRPRSAVLKVLKKEFVQKMNQSPFINKQKNTIEFYLQHGCAEQVSLCGSFNDWEPDVLIMEPGENGIWRIEIPLLASGKHFYKFYVDEHIWLEDIDNPWREPDGLNGWNSVLLLEN